VGLLFLTGCAKAEVAAKEPPSPEPVAAEPELRQTEEKQGVPPIECPAGTELQEQWEGDLIFCAEIRGDRMVLKGPIQLASRKTAQKEGVLRLAGEFARGYPTGLWQAWNGRTGEPIARGEFAPVTDGPVSELPVDIEVAHVYWSRWLKAQPWREPGASMGGRRHGKWIVWYSTHRGVTNKACEGRFFDDERHGKWRCWYPSGKVWWMGRYEGGRKEGEWTVTHPTGWLWAHVPMQADLPHGEYLRKHDDGVPAAKGQYSHGKKVGKWAYWDEEGRRLQEDPWRFELPQLHSDNSEREFLAYVEHGPQGQRYGALKHLIVMEGRKEHDLTRELWLREKQRERAKEEQSARPFSAPTLGPMLLLALYDMKPWRYLEELRMLHAFRFEGEDADRFKAGGPWRGDSWTGGVFHWVGETGYRLMLRGELPTGDALEATRVALYWLAASPSLKSRRRAAEVFAKFEGSPAFDPEVFPGTTKENAAQIVTDWLAANLGTCKWNRKAQVHRCSPTPP
jgi:hypothetical protein